ncbi:MAG: hypothetical protein LVQ96_00580 [Thermoplasmatales archaeon]|nr:hypothetical protein [Thermoplasmatales archaeon]MCW6169653.1 hypothetical protein [Thermoplasmatales archaeon]
MSEREITAGIVASAIVYTIVSGIIFLYALPYVHNYFMKLGIPLFLFVTTTYYLTLVVIFLVLIFMQHLFKRKWYNSLISAGYLTVEVVILFLIFGSGFLSLHPSVDGISLNVLMDFRTALYLIILSEVFFIIADIFKAFEKRSDKKKRIAHVEKNAPSN